MARNTFEIAALLSVQTSDIERFQRHVAQLRPFYAQPTVNSNRRSTVIGLNLLFLLVENCLAEFHSNLSCSALTARHPKLRFPFASSSLMVEATTMLSAKASMPSPHFKTSWICWWIPCARDRGV